MRARCAEPVVAGILESCGLSAYAHTPPVEMVPEREVTRLYAAIRATLPREEARAVARDAGARTAGYVLTYRIPDLAQGILPALPRALGRRALLLALGANAWTFAGSARLRMRFKAPSSITLSGCPICGDAQAAQPLCEYYSATFQHLFRTLVDSAYRVEEVACRAEGAAACVFQIEAA